MTGLEMEEVVARLVALGLRVLAVVRESSGKLVAVASASVSALGTDVSVDGDARQK